MKFPADDLSRNFAETIITIYQMAKEAWYLVPNVVEDCGQNIFTSKRYQVWYLQNIDAQQNSRVHYEIWGYQSEGLIAASLDI